MASFKKQVPLYLDLKPMQKTSSKIVTLPFASQKISGTTDRPFRRRITSVGSLTSSKPSY
jgi:hypothetical protein